MAWINERLTKGGKKRFRAVIRKKGDILESKTFPNRTAAERWARNKEADIDEGRYFKTMEADKHTLSELIERYEREHIEKIARAKQRSQFNWWKGQLGHYRLSNITTALLKEKIDELKCLPTPRPNPRSSSTVIRYMAALSHVFTKAVKEYEWMNENPLLKIEKRNESCGRVRFLDDDERIRLLEACKQSENRYLYSIVVLALSTGMRLMEMMSLKWSHVDLEKRRVTLYKTKNNEIRTVPLVGHAYEEIKVLLQNRTTLTELLFPGKNNQKPVDIRSAWESAVKRANIQNFRFHDLRHSAASYLIMNGASLAEIAEVLGHKTLQMVKRYAHFSDSHTAGVVERMNEKIFGIS